jgi:hypothetical protein
MKTIAEQWIEASTVGREQLNVPNDHYCTIVKELRKITSKAKPFKQGIKFPKGEKVKIAIATRQKNWILYFNFIRTRGRNEEGLNRCADLWSIIRPWRQLHLATNFASTSLLDGMRRANYYNVAATNLDKEKWKNG